jgi:histidine ammonia-lyase
LASSPTGTCRPPDLEQLQENLILSHAVGVGAEVPAEIVRLMLLHGDTIGDVRVPRLLIKDTGLNSGFMIPQYTAAALVSENKVLAHPASVDSIPSSLGQEDHVSMGAISAMKLLQVVQNTETVLAIEFMCAAQGLEFLRPLRAGRGVEAAFAEVRRVIPFAQADRLFHDDVQTALALVRSERLIVASEQAAGRLR